MMDTETGESQPLPVDLVDENSPLLIFNDDPEADDVLLGDVPPWTPIEISVSALAGVTVVTAIAALLISSNPIVVATSVIGLLVPPYTAFQEQKKTDCIAMEQTSETMENELENLKVETERLEGATKELESSIVNLQSLRAVFEEIREMEDTSLDALEEQMEESKEIMSKMHESNLDVVLQNIFDILLASDKNADDILSDEEINNLILSLEGINNVEIHDETMKKLIIDEGRDVNAVMKLCKNIMDNDPNTGPEDKDEIYEKVITFL